MKILLILSGMLVLCSLYGKLISIIVSRETQPRAIGPHIGYAYLLVFFFGFYIALHSAQLAVYCTLLAPIPAAGAVELRKRLRRGSAPPAATHTQPRINNEIRYLLVIGIVVLAFAVWPYLFSGWGNFWQSGNADMEDGLNGRDAYINGLIFDTRTDPGKVMGDRSWYDFAKITGTLSLHVNDADTYRKWYAGDGFRFQYSSLAFWSVVFQERHGLDILLEQELTNLLLMFVGIYFLSRRSFLMSEAASGTAAAASVLSVFYLTTYFAGHEGSLIYGSLSPAVLYLALAKPQKKLPLRPTMAYLVLILLAIGFSYPHPLAALVPPVVAYRLWGFPRFREALSRMRGFLEGRTFRSVLAALLVAAIAVFSLIALWHFTEGYRLRQEGQYRAWGYTHDWLIVPLFLGLIPSPLEGTTFLGATLLELVYWLFIAVACLLAITLAACYCRFRPAVNSRFFLFFGACWVLLYFVFRYFIVDSYYLYKFLYTHQYLLIVGLVGFLTTTRYRLLKVAAGAVLLTNLVSDFGIARAMYRTPFNHDSGEMAKLLAVEPEILRRSFVEVSGGEGVVVRQVLKAHGIETSLDPRFADYFIVPSDRESDITGAQYSQVVARGGARFAIKRAPAANYLMIRTWNEPEWAYADAALRTNVFRWVGSGKNDNLGIYLIRPTSGTDTPGRYLRICMQAGPSAFGRIPITVTGGAQAVIARLELDGMRCVWIPSETVRNAPQPLVIRSGVRGKSLLPRDDRILLYRVFAVGWTEKPYDEQAMSVFNMDKDITSPEGHAAGNSVAVRLGQGWQALETNRGSSFRWAGRSPEIVLPHDAGEGFTNIALDLEPGPSYGPGPFRLTVEDSAGRPVFESSGISGRETLRFRLKHSAPGPSVYVLRSHGKGVALPKDPRELDFRAFHITCGKSGD